MFFSFPLVLSLVVNIATSIYESNMYGHVLLFLFFSDVLIQGKVETYMHVLFLLWS